MAQGPVSDFILEARERRLQEMIDRSTLPNKAGELLVTGQNAEWAMEQLERVQEMRRLYAEVIEKSPAFALSMGLLPPVLVVEGSSRVMAVG